MLICLLLAVLLSCCGDKDFQYEVDGVTIVREDGAGPREVEMVLTSEVFRREASTAWDLDDTTERMLWMALRSISWTDGVLNGGGYYRNEAIRVTWTGCAVDSPLYELLTRHYFGLLTGSERRGWAQELTAEFQFLCQGHAALSELLDSVAVEPDPDP